MIVRAHNQIVAQQCWLQQACDADGVCVTDG
jgi:hypothetical protein